MTLRCSDAAAARGDSMLGTAPPQRDWLLVEHPGPWPVSAPFGADLSDALLRELGHPALRTLFIRRHGRDGAADRLTGQRRWFRCHAGGLRSGLWEQPEELLASLDPDAGQLLSGPLLLVCAHGVHDLCCAVKGRPVARALAERWPEATYECSHVGGDRFAPNLLLFPDLTCYAGMSAAEATMTVESHLAGRMDATRLRGVAGLHPAEQVALGTVLSRFGPAPAGAAAPRLVDQTGSFDNGRWTVDVEGAGELPERVRVVLESSRRAEATLTCRAIRPTRALEWSVVSVHLHQL
ncbi:MAG: sucrase ferredoxin [Nocardioides sp.]